MDGAQEALQRTREVIDKTFRELLERRATVPLTRRVQPANPEKAVDEHMQLVKTVMPEAKSTDGYCQWQHNNCNQL